MKYFNKEDFKCSCCGENKISDDLLLLLDKAASEVGERFIITSGYRCEKHNEAVGGVKRSSHIRGLAADIAVNNSNKDEILEALAIYFDRVGIGKNFIHVDIDSSKRAAIWYYKK